MCLVLEYSCVDSSGLPGVLLVLPDAYLDVPNKDWRFIVFRFSSDWDIVREIISPSSKPI